MAYDEKFRRRVIQYKDTGHTFAQTQEAFGVRPGSYYAWKAELEETGKFENHYPQNRKGKIDSEKLKELAEKHPDLPLREFAAEFCVRLQAIGKRFKAPGITRKKNFHIFRKKRGKTGRVLSGGGANTGKRPRIC
jgi:transposase